MRKIGNMLNSLTEQFADAYFKGMGSEYVVQKFKDDVNKLGFGNPNDALELPSGTFVKKDFLNHFGEEFFETNVPDQNDNFTETFVDRTIEKLRSDKSFEIGGIVRGIGTAASLGVIGLGAGLVQNIVAPNVAMGMGLVPDIFPQMKQDDTIFVNTSEVLGISNPEIGVEKQYKHNVAVYNSMLKSNNGSHNFSFGSALPPELMQRRLEALKTEGLSMEDFAKIGIEKNTLVLHDIKLGKPVVEMEIVEDPIGPTRPLASNSSPVKVKSKPKAPITTITTQSNTVPEVKVKPVGYPLAGSLNGLKMPEPAAMYSSELSLKENLAKANAFNLNSIPGYAPAPIAQQKTQSEKDVKQAIADLKAQNPISNPIPSKEGGLVDTMKGTKVTTVDTQQRTYIKDYENPQDFFGNDRKPVLTSSKVDLNELNSYIIRGEDGKIKLSDKFDFSKYTVSIVDNNTGENYCLIFDLKGDKTDINIGDAEIVTKKDRLEQVLTGIAQDNPYVTDFGFGEIKAFTSDYGPAKEHVATIFGKNGTYLDRKKTEFVGAYKSVTGKITEIWNSAIGYSTNGPMSNNGSVGGKGKGGNNGGRGNNGNGNDSGRN